MTKLEKQKIKYCIESAEFHRLGFIRGKYTVRANRLRFNKALTTIIADIKVSNENGYFVNKNQRFYVAGIEPWIRSFYK